MSGLYVGIALSTLNIILFNRYKLFYLPSVILHVPVINYNKGLINDLKTRRMFFHDKINKIFVLPTITQIKLDRSSVWSVFGHIDTVCFIIAYDINCDHPCWAACARQMLWCCAWWAFPRRCNSFMTLEWLIQVYEAEYLNVSWAIYYAIVCFLHYLGSFLCQCKM